MQTKFYTFRQNNSGGRFDFNAEDGISHYVIIEAQNANHAKDRAERIGLYFNGCDFGKDCSCCGDRWSDYLDDSDGTDVPMVYDTPAKQVEFGTSPNYRWMDGKPEGFIHYIGGRFEGFGAAEPTTIEA